MHSHFLSRAAGRCLLSALFVGVVLALPGCDNPACVFGGNCFGSGVGTGVGLNPASVPANGEWISSAVPKVMRFLPSSVSGPCDTRSPVVVEFSESMSSTNLNIAFNLREVNSGDVPFGPTALIGDGKFLVMFPLTPLIAGASYEIHYRNGVNFQDHTGQTVVIPTDTLVGSFSVAATNAATPKVLGVFPESHAAAQSATGEIDVVFDRPMDATTLTSSSFVVQENLVAPTNDPNPTALVLAGGLTTDTRVFRWRSTDSGGTPVPLTTNANITLQLSPASNQIKDSGGALLAVFNSDYKIAAFSAPTAVRITSSPSDAIGIAQISGPADLAIKVDFADAAAGDHVLVTMIGTKTGVPTNPPLTALVRDVALVSPFTTITLTAAEIDLLLTASPVAGRFADGNVAFAFQVARGSLVSPVRMLDVDAATPGSQGPVLDTVAPTLLGLSSAGTTTTSFTSDMRDLVVVGRANEALRAAKVVTGLGDNVITAGALPPVTGSHASGLFVCNPVHVGLLDEASQPLSFTLQIFDRALNAGPTISASFRQWGSSGPGTALPGASVTVRVFDANTLAPIVGANVHTDEDLLGLMLGVGDAVTDANGLATLAAGALGRTIVTVKDQTAGYELFTFDGVPTDHISVPLQPAAAANATVAGQVTTTNAEITLYTEGISNTCAADPGTPFYAVNTCSFQPAASLFECPYNAVPIRPARLGAAGATAVLIPGSIFLYSAATFLKGAEIALPIPPAAPGAATSATVAFPFLLDAAGLDPEEQAIDVTAHSLSTVNYPLLNGLPIIAVQGTSPGIPGAVTVGRGVPFSSGLPPDTYAIRAAYPGSVDGIADVPTDLLGRYVTRGTIGADLQLRAQVLDTVGNVGVARPRLSVSALLPMKPPAPALLSPPVVVDAGGTGLDLSFTDVLPDSTGETGIYRVTLTDSVGQKWTVWRSDTPDSAGSNITVHLSFVGAGGTFPLTTGTITVQIALFAWPGFDPAQFLWSDIEREYDLASFSKSQTFTTP